MFGIPVAAIYIFLFIALSITIILIIKKWIIPLRGYTQLSLFVISEITFICNKGIPCESCPLSFGICPVGTTQRIAFIRHFPFYVTLILIAITGLIFGTLTCGWACPIGFIQDIFHAPGIKEIKVSNKFKVIRITTLFLSAVLIYLELRFHFFSIRGMGVFNPFVIIGGGLLLATAIFLKRPFCRMLCPLGFIYGKLNKISPIKVSLNKETCVACGNCNKVCITDTTPIKEVNRDLCAKCFNCKKVCSELKN